MQSVAVIGASAAGLFAAYLLARKGVDVRVFEQAERLDPTPRTLIVTSRMRDLLGPIGERAVVNEIRRFELCTDGRVGTIQLERPDLVIERSVLVRELAGHAEAAGARMLVGRRFVGLEASGEGLTFAVERIREGGTEGTYAGTVIGADGAFSAVARAGGWPQLATLTLIQATVRLPPDLPPDTTRIWFIPEDTPYFYWLIPESPTRGVLGLIGEGRRETSRRLDRFLKTRRLEPIEFQAARIPGYARWVPIHQRVGEGDVYLVGDAAGQVKVTTVGGLVTGFRGALGVAEAILNGGASRELTALRRELNIHLLIRRALHHFAQKDYVGLLDLLNRSAQRSLGAHTRDEAGKLLRHLCLLRPRFLLLGLRVLLTARSQRRP